MQNTWTYKAASDRINLEMKLTSQGANRAFLDYPIWQATHEPTHNRRAAALPPRIQSRLHDGRKNGRKLALGSPTRHRRQASSIDDGIAIMSKDRSLDGGAVAGRADDDGIELGTSFGGDFAGCAHVRNDLMLVGEEGGEHAGANTASDAEEKHFHRD